MKLLTQTEMGAAIAAVRSNQETQDSLVQQVVCSGLSHTRDHGDIRGLVNLVNALSTGTRREAVCEFIRAFSGKQLLVHLDKKAGQYVGKLAPNWSAEKFDVDGAIETFYGDFTKEKVATTLDLKALRKLIARVANNTGSNPDGTPKVMDSTRALASRFVSLIDEAAIAAKA